MVSSATSPAAASTPACRRPPPAILRIRRARATNSRLPVTTDPTGAESPLERQNVTESATDASSDGGTPSATEALKIRAPSMCTAMPFARATSTSGRICSTV